MCFELSIYTSHELIQSWSVDKQQEFPMIGLASEPVFQKSQRGISLLILFVTFWYLKERGFNVSCL